MRAFRRGLLVASLALLAGGVVRILSSKDAAPPVSGGWRELEGPNFR